VSGLYRSDLAIAKGRQRAEVGSVAAVLKAKIALVTGALAASDEPQRQLLLKPVLTLWELISPGR
jgi:hypothetical protein